MFCKEEEKMGKLEGGVVGRVKSRKAGRQASSHRDQVGFEYSVV